MAGRHAGLPEALLALGAAELGDRVARGALGAADLAEACLARIEGLEPSIGAWAWHDPAFVRHQAGELDRHRAAGRPTGALHGLPVGLADLIDTARIPTENGCALDAGRVPGADAYVVTGLKQAGALFMGKTATSELGGPGATVANPHDRARSAGGASAGSAAAVATGMVPLAVGTDSCGDATLSAAYCGVTGFVPSFGAVPRTGILARAQSIDRVAVFARDPVDAALLGEVLFGYDAGDRATTPSPAPHLAAAAREAPPLTPVLAVIRPAGWAEADPEAREAFAELQETLGEQCFEVELPAHFTDAPALLDRIRLAEMARSLHRYARGAEKLEPATREMLARGDDTRARDYLAALDWRDVLYAGLDEILHRADAILAPAAPGPAPTRPAADRSSLGAIWALCGVPSVALPILQSSAGLPMAVQLIGARGNDARLLRTANWLYHLAEPDRGREAPT